MKVIKVARTVWHTYGVGKYHTIKGAVRSKCRTVSNEQCRSIGDGETEREKAESRCCRLAFGKLLCRHSNERWTRDPPTSTSTCTLLEYFDPPLFHCSTVQLLVSVLCIEFLEFYHVLQFCEFPKISHSCKC